MKTLLFLGVIVGVGILGVSSLECVICNSVDHPDCGHGDEVDTAKYLRPCNTTEESFKKQLPTLPPNQSYKLCRKMVTTVDFAVNENKAGVRIKRTCGWDDSEVKYNNVCYYRAGLGGRITVCTCGTDKCNGASTVTQSVTLGSASVGMMVVALVKYWV